MCFSALSTSPSRIAARISALEVNDDHFSRINQQTHSLCRLMASRSSLYSDSFASRWLEAYNNLEVCRTSSENALAVSIYPSCARYCATSSCKSDSSLPPSWSADESPQWISSSNRSLSCYIRPLALHNAIYLRTAIDLQPPCHLYQRRKESAQSSP